MELKNLKQTGSDLSILCSKCEHILDWLLICSIDLEPLALSQACRAALMRLS